MNTQREQLLLYTLLTLGLLLVCLAVGYAGPQHKGAPPVTVDHHEHKPNPPQHAPHTPTHQPLTPIAEDSLTWLCNTPEVKAIYAQWQAINSLTWQKDRGICAQPHYLYRKGHYIYAFGLGTFNILLLPLLWGYLSYTFCGNPITIGKLPIIPTSWEIAILRLSCYLWCIDKYLYPFVYKLVERFIGKQLIIAPAESQKIVQELYTDTQALLKKQASLRPLDHASFDEMIALQQELLYLGLGYNHAIGNATLPQQQSIKKALQRTQQIWNSRYAIYHEYALLLSIAEDLAQQTQIITDKAI